MTKEWEQFNSSLGRSEILLEKFKLLILILRGQKQCGYHLILLDLIAHKIEEKWNVIHFVDNNTLGPSTNNRILEWWRQEQYL